MQTQKLLRVLVAGIVTVLAVMLLGLVANLGGALLALGLKAVAVLLLVAIVVRFMTLLDDKRNSF